MTLTDTEHRLLYRIAHAYYIDAMTQQQIAQQFGLSRPKVSRLLQQARDTGVVQISLLSPPAGSADLEWALESHYGLDEIVLVDVDNPDDSGTVASALGEVAADYLMRCLSGTETIAIAWGRSISAMVDALPQKSWPAFQIVQLTGGLGTVGSEEHSAELAQQMGRRLNARVYLIPAPGIVSSVETATVLRADYQITSTLAMAARADVAVVGLGVPNPESLLVRDGHLLQQRDFKALKKQQAVGDLALRFVDHTGQAVHTEMDSRIIGLSLEAIQHIPRVIGIAGGTEKYDIIRAALKGKRINVLITDSVTGQRLNEDMD